MECLVAANKRKLRGRRRTKRWRKKKKRRFRLQVVRSYFDETLLEYVAVYAGSLFERYRNWFERQSNRLESRQKISVRKRWKINQSPGRYRSNCLAQRKATVNFPEEIDLFLVCRDNSPLPSSQTRLVRGIVGPVFTEAVIRNNTGRPFRKFITKATDEISSSDSFRVLSGYQGFYHSAFQVPCRRI